MCFASWQAKHQEGNVKKKIPGNQDLEKADVFSGRLCELTFGQELWQLVPRISHCLYLHPGKPQWENNKDQRH